MRVPSCTSLVAEFRLHDMALFIGLKHCTNGTMYMLNTGYLHLN